MNASLRAVRKHGVAIHLLFMLPVDGVSVLRSRRLPRLKLRSNLAMTVIFCIERQRSQESIRHCETDAVSRGNLLI